MSSPYSSARWVMPGSDDQNIYEDFAADLRHFAGVTIGEGVLFVALGAVAAFVPLLTTIDVIVDFRVLVGLVLLAGGGIGAAAALWERRVASFWWSLVSSLTALIAGAMILWWPGSGLALTSFVAPYFAADGLVVTILAFEYHRRLNPQWGWLLTNGLVDLAFAAILFLWPDTSNQTLALMIGADMAAAGISLFAIGVTSRMAEYTVS